MGHLNKQKRDVRGMLSSLSVQKLHLAISVELFFELIMAGTVEFRSDLSDR
jgi:hypothetical protein